jgi:hypothetical protein
LIYYAAKPFTSSGSYIRGRVGKILFTSFLAFVTATIVADLAPFWASA